MSTLDAVSLWRPVGVEGQVPAGADSGGSSPVRLTRRGRIVSVLAALVVVAWLVVLVISRAAGAAPAPGAHGADGQAGAAAPAAMTTVTVRDGDSLWAIAERTAPGLDPRELVERIRDVNGLTSSLIQPGQVLLVPAGS